MNDVKGMEEEDFLVYSRRSMEDLEDADYDMLKRGRDLDEIRSMCGIEDVRLIGLIEEQQDFLNSSRKRRMERIEDLEYYTKEKVKEFEKRQEDKHNQVKEDKEQYDNE